MFCLYLDRHSQYTTGNEGDREWRKHMQQKAPVGLESRDVVISCLLSHSTTIKGISYSYAGFTYRMPLKVCLLQPLSEPQGKPDSESQVGDHHTTPKPAPANFYSNSKNMLTFLVHVQYFWCEFAINLPLYNTVFLHLLLLSACSRFIEFTTADAVP